MAEKNQSNILIRSIHTAFFILLIPLFPSGFSCINIFPKIPNTAAQRILMDARQFYSSSIDYQGRELTIRPDPIRRRNSSGFSVSTSISLSAFLSSSQQLSAGSKDEALTIYTSAVTALNVAIATAYPHFESEYLPALFAAWRSVA